MNIEFYNVKKREKVSISDTGVKKAKYERKTSAGVQVRYAFRAQDDDGTNLTKFCSKADWDKLTAEVV
ncbi:hypothetical protein HOH87_02485 [bacterium]|jgi:hypothetical protein|nr:hypothetical protein [bacterium]